MSQIGQFGPPPGASGVAYQPPPPPPPVSNAVQPPPVVVAQAGPVAPPRYAPAPVLRQRALRLVGVGMLLLVVGIAISIVTYQVASGTGGYYFVMYGPIILGVLSVVRGIILLVRSTRLR